MGKGKKSAIRTTITKHKFKKKEEEEEKRKINKYL
jgi:hypothetical protein